ncbi:unnamed protein product, partial [Polarella glacialis]
LSQSVGQVGGSPSVGQVGFSPSVGQVGCSPSVGQCLDEGLSLQPSASQLDVSDRRQLSVRFAASAGEQPPLDSGLTSGVAGSRLASTPASWMEPSSLVAGG